MIIFIFLFSGLETILLTISDLNGLSTVIQRRLTDIYEAIRFEEVNWNSSLGSRLTLTLTSWNTFKNNILFGINFGEYTSLTIGSHTQWIDNLARYGLFGNILLVIQFSFWINSWFVNSKKMEEKLAVILSWVFFILLGFLTNNMMAGIFICMFVISNNLSSLKPLNLDNDTL